MTATAPAKRLGKRILRVRLVLTIAARVFGVAFTALFVFILSRSLGPSDAGAIMLTWASATYTTSLCRLGLHRKLLRLVSINRDTSDRVAIRGFVLQVFAITAFASLTVSGFIFLFRDVLLRMFDENINSQALTTLLAISIPCLTASQMSEELLKGRGFTEFASFLQTGFAASIAVFIFLFSGMTFECAVLALKLTSITMLLLSAVIVVSLFGRGSGWKTLPVREIASGALQNWLFDVMRVGVLWLPYLALGAFSTSAQVGFYAAAERVARTVNIAFVAISNVVSPEFARWSNEGDFMKMQNLLQNITRSVIYFCGPITLIIAFNAGLIMRCFGDDYVAGGYALAAIVIAQFIHGVSGISIDVLMMSRLERIATVSAFASLVSGVGICTVGASVAGAFGAASGVLLMFLVQGSLNVYLLYRVTGIRAFSLLPPRSFSIS